MSSFPKPLLLNLADLLALSMSHLTSFTGPFRAIYLNEDLDGDIPTLLDESTDVSVDPNRLCSLVFDFVLSTLKRPAVKSQFLIQNGVGTDMMRQLIALAVYFAQVTTDDVCGNSSSW